MNVNKTQINIEFVHKDMWKKDKKIYMLEHEWKSQPVPIQKLNIVHSCFSTTKAIPQNIDTEYKAVTYTHGSQKFYKINFKANPKNTRMLHQRHSTI